MATSWLLWVTFISNLCYTNHMKCTKKKISDTKVELKVTLDAADLERARALVLADLAKNLKIQGFRKGKAPISMVEQSVSPNEVANETIDRAVRVFMAEAFDSEDLAPIAISGVDVEKYVPNEMAEYKITADVLPDVKLGDYKKLKAKMPKTEPTAKDVQEVLDRITDAYSEVTKAERPAKNGDIVIIDFVGKKDGKAFDGGTAKDYRLELGSGSFIPGFEEAIITHEVGDQFNIDLKFPDNYFESSLAGQPVVFEVTLKEVDEKKKPKQDDELAKKCGDFKTIDELKADIKKNLEIQNSHKANEEYREALVKEFMEKSKVAAPEILIQDQLRFIKDDMTRNAAGYGMSFEEYLKNIKQTEEEWEKEARKLAEARVKTSLVLQVLAKEQKISATNEEVEAKIAELRDLYQKSKEALNNLKKPEVRQDIRNRLIIDKTVDFLVDQNK